MKKWIKTRQLYPQTVFLVFVLLTNLWNLCFDDFIMFLYILYKVKGKEFCIIDVIFCHISKMNAEDFSSFRFFSFILQRTIFC